MTHYINWCLNNAPISGDKLQMQGNPSKDHEVPSDATASAVAGSAHYASVWSTAACTVLVTNIRMPDGTLETTGFTKYIPANYVLDIPNLTAASTITMTA